MRKPTSIIIPTYGRSEDVIIRTIDSILDNKTELSETTEIILIDQNSPALSISDHYQNKEGVCYIQHKREDTYNKNSDPRIQLIHIMGGKPSVTMSKNYGIKISTGEFFIFFDDDVIVQKGCLERHHDMFYSKNDVAFIGGREIVNPPTLKRSSLREFLIKILELFSGNEEEREYKYKNHYVGRIKPNSFMLSNFDVESDSLVRINGARGCNWSSSRENILNAGCFDESFQGSAIREETDLYLRIEKLGKEGYFDGKAAVIHMRQLGGCDNMSKSITTLESKLKNELYFQRKHFNGVSSVYFLIRLLPLGLESLKDTRGMSLLILLRSWFSFLKKKTI